MPKPPDPFDPAKDLNDEDLLREIAEAVAITAERINHWRNENPELARIQDVHRDHEIARDLQAAAEQRAEENCRPDPRRYRF